MKDKKKIIAIGVGIVLFIVGFILLIHFGTKTEKNNLISITAAEYLEKIENEEDFILVYVKTDCSYCETYKPMLNNVLVENNITAYMINLADLTDEEKESISDYLDIEGTPTTLFFHDGVEDSSDRLVGTGNTEDNIKNVLINRGFISEDE